MNEPSCSSQHTGYRLQVTGYGFSSSLPSASSNTLTASYCTQNDSGMLSLRVISSLFGLYEDSMMSFQPTNFGKTLLFQAAVYHGLSLCTALKKHVSSFPRRVTPIWGEQRRTRVQTNHWLSSEGKKKRVLQTLDPMKNFSKNKDLLSIKIKGKSS